MEEGKALKKVLIITYYWPSAGGPGVQRVLKFAKYLPEFGWEPIILTVRDGEYPAYDESLLKDVSPELKIYHTRSIEPFSIYKVLTGQKRDSRIDNYVLKNKRPGLLARISKWIRFNLFIPDARVGWVPFAFQTGTKILEEENINVIFSSSPPHSLQLAAHRLARKSGKPWVVDFRDPWSSIVYYQDESRIPLAESLDRRWENKVLTQASQVITISEAVKEELDQIGHRKDTHVIYNGYDAQDFPSAERKISRRENGKTVITYAGFLSDTRIPHALLEVLSENQGGKLDQIELQLFGRTSPQFDQLVKNMNLDGQIVMRGYVDHTNLVQELCESDALLMVVDDVSDNKGILTGKLFDYMGAGKPIIAIGPLDGEVEKIIERSSSGWYVEYKDTDKMKRCLLQLLDGHLTFEFDTQPYERKNLTGQLADILNKLHG